MENYGYMYHAQACVNDDVYFMRTWEEVVKFFNILSDHYITGKNTYYVCYIHNLSFEFQFMRNFFDWESIFAVKEREPIRCRTTRGIEFRCSYKLSNMSLSKFCKYTGAVHYKKEGEIYDYSKIRTPSTVNTNYEDIYDYCDVKGLYECIKQLLKEDNLATIPMTSTGYVRRDCRKAVLSNSNNRLLFKSCQINELIYVLLRTARRGGDCASNPIYTGEIIDCVDSWDIKSSYPYEMMTAEFPMGEWVEDSGKHISDNRAYIMTVSFTNICIKSTDIIGYIPFAKCTSKENVINCNGRILKASHLSMVITDVDLDIINSRYTCDEMEVTLCFSCHKEMLPKELREVIANYFYMKEELDGIDDYAYMKSKNKLNAIFGMMLTDITSPDYIYDKQEGWTKDVGDVTAKLLKYFDNPKSFLAYQWGVWVTALARQRLDEPYRIVHECALYSDTDAWKLRNGYDKQVFIDINNKIMNEADMYDVKPYVTTSRGDTYYLGVWEYEGTYDKFKTLGAKKYCVEKNGKSTVTVAGLSKKKGSDYLEKIGGISHFKDKLEFPYEYSGRTYSVYDDDNSIREITVNGDTFTTSSSMAIHETTYNLDRTGEYVTHLNNLRKYGITYLK